MSDVMLIFFIEGHVYAILLLLCSRKFTLNQSILSAVE